MSYEDILRETQWAERKSTASILTTLTLLTMHTHCALWGHTMDEMNNVFAHFVFLTKSSQSIVNKIAFKELWQYATQVDLELPSVKVVKHWVMQMFEWMKENINHLFMDVDWVSLTRDVWTVKNHIELLEIIVHLVDEKWHYSKQDLGVH